MPGPSRNKYLPQDETLSQTKNSLTLSLKFLYIFGNQYSFFFPSQACFLSQTKMLCFPSSCFLPLQSSSTFSNTILKLKHPPQLIQQPSIISIKLKAAASDTPQVDYNSMASSVFPAEACETVGGVACDVEMFPETKLKEAAEPKPKLTTAQTVDREYVEYNSPKTVFIAEACDDLGGEFCDADST
ncbi:hypothetical protein L6452_21387 [Arctium lappa]|uniref:Uncharacterized protein n=1 Tax=Arctium lappa TaxID=4217 RepID=A0ACB9BDK9_ARCLA|nr:hypothetical protein L6452_21387 [Arctium lappa]